MRLPLPLTLAALTHVGLWSWAGGLTLSLPTRTPPASIDVTLSPPPSSPVAEQPAGTTPNRRRPVSPRSETKAPEKTPPPTKLPLDLTDTVLTTVASTDGGGAMHRARLLAPSPALPTSLLPGTSLAKTSSPSSQAAAARPLDGQWQCPWPSTADDSSLTAAMAIVRVELSEAGAPLRAQVLRDPGEGFAAAAEACALRARFQPALDAYGHPIRAWTPPLRVHFLR